MDRPNRPSISDFVADLDDDKIFDQKVNDRCAYFIRTFNAYNARLTKSGLDGVKLNRFLLINAIESYFLDIRRLKAFHGMERADRFKIGGYTVKWLTKIKPIQAPEILDLKPDLEKRMLLVNADFSLMEALQISRINHKIIPRKFVTGLLYSAHYREIDPGITAQFLEMAATAWPIERPKATTR